MKNSPEPFTRESFTEGRVLLLDKPYAWTSFDVVGKVRALLRHVLGVKKPKVGHAGTLDPLATGLLVVCTGRMTKSITSYQDMEKEYTGTMVLGQTTPSYDLETEPDGTYPHAHITREGAEAAARSLCGCYGQLPPQFSAKKVAGERAYAFARRGETTRLEPREVDVREFEITRFDLPEVDFRISCSKGTYIRALARDFGKALGSGAYLKSLRRVRIGQLHVEQAVCPATLEQLLRESAG
jgi:tRNA pseudouridine55 synthase